MQGLLQFFETDLEDGCSLGIHSEHVWHRGVMVVAGQVSLNIPVHFIVLSKFFFKCHIVITLHCTVLVYITTYSTMQCIIQCDASQCETMHCTMHCNASHVKCTIELNTMKILHVQQRCKNCKSYHHV